MKNKNAVTALFTAGFVTLLSFAALCGPLDTWQLRHPPVQVSSLSGIAYGNGNLVAVGSGGLLISSNGTAWIGQRSGELAPSAVAFGNGLFLALGERHARWMSNDGLSWTQIVDGSWTSVNDMTFGNGRFVAIGHDDGMSLSSALVTPDGTNFQGVVFSDKALYGICHGNGFFVTVGESGAVQSSGDGLSWTMQPSPTTNTLFGITFGSGTFVAVGAKGAILTTTNLLDWTRAASGTESELHRAIYVNGEFLVVGGDPDSPGVIVKSTNAVDWVSVQTPASGALFGLIYANGLYVSVGASTTILTSSDGLNWMSRGSAGPFSLFGGLYEGNRFVVVGGCGTILSSSDGVEWSPQNSGSTHSLFAVASGAGVTVAGGEQGTLLTSTDRLSWAAQTLGSGAPIRGLAYGNDRFLAVCGAGVDGFAATWFSTNGINWALASKNQNNEFNHVAFGGGMFLATTPFGDVLTTADGTVWTQHAGWFSPNALTFGAGRFVAAGDDLGIVTSTDGITWTDEPSPMGPYAIGYGDGCFVAYRDDGLVSSEAWGSWVSYKIPVSMGRLGTVVFGNGTFILAGPYGTILQSGPRIRLVAAPAPPSSFEFTLTGRAGLNYRVETSADLASWTTWTNVLSTGPNTVIRDTNPPGARLYYRAVYP